MAWNRSSGAPKVAPKKSPSKMRGLVAGLVVVCALGGLCLWMFFGDGDENNASAKKERGRIKAVTPATMPTNKVAEVKKPVDPREDYDHERCYRDADGVLRYKHNDGRAFDKTEPAHPPVFPQFRSRRVFRHQSEREIATLLEMEPGEHRLDSPDYYDKDFEKSFMKALTDGTPINDDDSASDKELKKAVEEAKKEIAARIRKGEKLGDILSETSKEMSRLAAYKDDLSKQIHNIIKNGQQELSDNDVRDLVAAANKMLEEKGVNPVDDADDLVKWNIRLKAKRMKNLDKKEKTK